MTIWVPGLAKSGHLYYDIYHKSQTICTNQSKMGICYVYCVYLMPLTSFFNLSNHIGTILYGAKSIC